jgi:hypothetical protein
LRKKIICIKINEIEKKEPIAEATFQLAAVSVPAEEAKKACEVFKAIEASIQGLGTVTWHEILGKTSFDAR